MQIAVTHCPPDGTSFNDGVRLISSAIGPVIRYAMSASPFFSIASRVDSSGTTFITSRFTAGALRQYLSYASKTTSTPGWLDTNRYGPAPIGCFLNPSSPTCSTYFFGTIHAAP